MLDSRCCYFGIILGVILTSGVIFELILGVILEFGVISNSFWASVWTSVISEACPGGSLKAVAASALPASCMLVSLPLVVFSNISRQFDGNCDFSG